MVLKRSTLKKDTDEEGRKITVTPSGARVGRPPGKLDGRQRVRAQVPYSVRVDLAQMVPGALKKLNYLALHAKSEAVQLGAITEILNRAIGRPKVAIDLGMGLEVEPIRSGMSSEEAVERFKAVLRRDTIRRRTGIIEVNSKGVVIEGEKAAACSSIEKKKP